MFYAVSLDFCVFLQHFPFADAFLCLSAFDLSGPPYLFTVTEMKGKLFQHSTKKLDTETSYCGRIF